jgi:hypothetical protein
MGLAVDLCRAARRRELLNQRDVPLAAQRARTLARWGPKWFQPPLLEAFEIAESSNAPDTISGCLMPDTRIGPHAAMLGYDMGPQRWPA